LPTTTKGGISQVKSNQIKRESQIENERQIKSNQIAKRSREIQPQTQTFLSTLTPGHLHLIITSSIPHFIIPH
jgi:hypothetical protein